MGNIELYFDGYCPESLLKGKQVEMKLNEDDFWESLETGLQMTVFPPYATILRWRGKGKIKDSSDIASNVLTGLVMTEANIDEGKEIFPNEDEVIQNKFDLEWYLDEIYDSKEEFDAAKFNPNDPIFEKQKKYLKTISKSEFEELLRLYDEAELMGYGSKDYFDFHQKLYDLNIIFSFHWMAWHKGRKNIEDTNFDYSNCSLLDVSMYLTTIFREDRFSDGHIEAKFKDGTLDKIFIRLKTKIPRY
jgi:Family of unknown function (DUF6508)